MIAFAHHLSRPYALVLLAGAIRPSPLRSHLDEPALMLPLSGKRRLLDLWIETIRATAAQCEGVKIVVSSERDAEVIREAVGGVECEHWELGRGATIRANNGTSTPKIEVLVDPSEWRGPAGLLHDIARQANVSDDVIVVAAEAASLPPTSLDQLLSKRADPNFAGVIGAGDEDRPAGVYAFSTETIRGIPAIGYHDIKEQLLPALYQNGRRVPVVRVVDEVVRLRDLDSYLRAVRLTLRREDDPIARSPDAKVSTSATLSGPCIIGKGVRIEDGAVVHESVVMDGAQIGGGAVIARSVVGRGSLVHARSVVRSAIVAPPEVPRPLPSRGRGLGRQTARRIFRGSLASGSPVHHEDDE